MLKLDSEALQYLLIFESVTKIAAKDCVICNKTVIFIVPEGKIGKAMGKSGAKIKRLQHKIKKEVKIVEFSHSPSTFLMNIFRNYRAKKARLEQQDDKVFGVVEVPMSMKAKAIGQNAKNIQIAKLIFNRYYHIDGIYVDAKLEG